MVGGTDIFMVLELGPQTPFVKTLTNLCQKRGHLVLFKFFIQYVNYF